MSFYTIMSTRVLTERAAENVNKRQDVWHTRPRQHTTIHALAISESRFLNHNNVHEINFNSLKWSVVSISQIIFLILEYLDGKWVDRRPSNFSHSLATSAICMSRTQSHVSKSYGNTKSIEFFIYCEKIPMNLHH